jgi:ubiquinone/menaquinone biosynthesis C-methylase UbiE
MLNSTWTGQAQAYDAVRDCWLNERRTRYIAGQLQRLGPLRRIVELGSGTGWLVLRLAAIFPKTSWLGVDPDEHYVDYARARAAAAGVAVNSSFVVGYGETLQKIVPPGADLLLSNDVLHHLEDEEATIHAASAVLMPGGHWLAIEPNPWNPYVAVRQATRAGERNFRPRRFIGTAANAGFRLVQRQYLFLLPPSLRQPPQWLQTLEAKLEGIPPVSGGVALLLEKMS